ncbi:MAG: DUF6090 family protein [Robiginitalea sp.]|uniref:DUF6090 family protein n=1 Tax=Robiginitalea sp. TaxID=1902411 RepID=UPI003C781BA0
MLRFFRHIRQRMISESRTRKYLLYAVGEILLVVIGILIALQVDNWNEDRRKHQQAAEFRMQLQEGILQDMQGIHMRLDFFDLAMKFGYQSEQELSYPLAKDVESQWQFIVQVFHVSQVWNFNQTTATYNEVQNPEILGHLGSPKLLNALQRHYNEWPMQLLVLTGGTQAYRDFVRSVIPMELQKNLWDTCYDIDFKDIQRFLPCSAPEGKEEVINQVYREILEDPAFKRLLTRRLSTLYARGIVYQNMLLEAESLLELLKTESQ